MKSILSLILCMVLVTSCGSLGQNLSGVTKQQIKAANIVGKNPVEVKKALGVPVYEGFFNGNKNSPLYFNHKGFFYALVYSTAPGARYAYNLNDKKSCHVLLFFKKKEFKFEHNLDAKKQVAKYCSPGLLNSHFGITETDTKKFWDKYGY